MLDDGLKTQLKGYLERLQQPVEILASLDESEGSREMLELLQDIAALSPRVSLEVRRDDAEVKPSFALLPGGRGAARALRRRADGPRVHFARARAAAGRRPPAEGGGEDARSGALARRRFAIRDVRVAELPELPRRGAGAQSHVGGESAGASHHDRRRAVSGGGRAPRRDGGAERVSERRTVRSGPYAARGDHREARRRCPAP